MNHVIVFYCEVIVSQYINLITEIYKTHFIILFPKMNYIDELIIPLSKFLNTEAHLEPGP